MKYKLKNIDCSLCAARLENELSKFSGIGKIWVDPLNSTIETDVKDVSVLSSYVRSVEPNAEIEIIRSDIETEKEENKREIKRISIVVLLLLTALIFKYELRDLLFNFIDTILLLSAYFISGWTVLKKAARNLTNRRYFDENTLMSIATIGAIIINELPEAVTVMLFYNVGEYLQGLSVKKNRRSVKSLMAIRPDYANLQKNGNILKVSPYDIKTGDIIIVKPGEKIPLDGVITSGESFADTFALTGESVPKKLRVGDEALSGMVNKTGLIILKVSRIFTESSFSKIINLVENASKRKAETEKFITSFAHYYTPAVVILAVLFAIIPPLFISGERFDDWVYRACVMLVISCPCALVISIPLGYFGGIGGASSKGILIKGSVYLDALTELKAIVFDKTGTLTKGVFNVTEMCVAGVYSKEEMLRLAAHAEANSNHPIGQSIFNAYSGEINHNIISGFNEIAGKGISAIVEGKKILAGNGSLMGENGIIYEKPFEDGTIIHVAVDGDYAGYFIISDELKDRASFTLQKLGDLGIKKIMLTGDTKNSASSIAGKLRLDDYYYGLLPEDKLRIFEKIMLENKPGKTAFVGDGINDAPVIARADIGFAMGGLGSDAAIEASDIVIMQDDPSKILEAINIAGKTRMIVWQNIFFALGVKVLFIVLGGLGIATMWEAVFGDMGVALIAILNSTRSFRS